LRIARGSLVALLGPSGCGKTALDHPRPASRAIPSGAASALNRG
jgi:hypothetical protein